jgi:glycosyltransferase involved in cell wall biosynthesis
VRFALLAPGGTPTAAERVARALAGRLAAAGHEAVVVLLAPDESPPFSGYDPHPRGTTTIERATREGARFDATVATSWEGAYAGLALEARARAWLLLREPRREIAAAGASAALAERALLERAIRIVATSDRAREGLARMGREPSATALLGVDLAAFSPAPPEENGRPLRALVEGRADVEADGVERALRVAAGIAGVETLHVATAGPPAMSSAARRTGPVPLDEMPGLLRSADVLLRLAAPGGADLLPLEALACGGIVIAASDGRHDAALRDGKSALLVPVGDDEAAARALERVARDAGLRQLLRAGAREAAPLLGLEARGAAIERALLEATDAPAEIDESARREMAAIGALLAQARPAARPPARTVASDSRLRRWRRRIAGAIGGAARLARPAADVPRIALPDDLRPGEPVIFTGLREYFRSAIHDAAAERWGIDHSIHRGNRDAIARLPEIAARTGAGSLVVFQPELLAAAPAVATALEAMGVRLVAYSTEPLPRDGAAEVHWDQLRRLESLRRARAVRWDLVVHFDATSLGVVRAEGFSRVVAHPVPVSARLFQPDPIERDIDVCFLGWPTPHRDAFLAPLRGRFRIVHVAHGLFDEDACRLMNRARLVVNLHCHAYANFENRCVQALFCDRPLASEPLSGDLLVPERDYLLARTPAELLRRAVELLEEGAPPPAPRFDRARFLAASLRDLLSATRAEERPG